MTVASVTDLPPVFDGIGAVCFDAFGTLVEITDRRGAYLPLLRALPGTARLELKRRLMREDRATANWPAALGVAVDGTVLARVEADIAAELASVRMRPGMADILARMRDAGLPTALCSNLASPYGPAVRTALPGRADVEVFSYRVGAIKPEPAIYARVAEALALAPGRILFVGDTMRADIGGPRAGEMKALHVDELERVMRHGGGR